MALLLKAAKPDDLSSNLEPKWWKEGTDSQKLPSDLHMWAHQQPTPNRDGDYDFAVVTTSFRGIRLQWQSFRGVYEDLYF